MISREGVLRLLRSRAKDMETMGDAEKAELLDGIADRVEDMPGTDAVGPPAMRQKKQVPFFKNSPITREAYVCGGCGVLLEKSDRYCWKCGRLIIRE